MNVLLVEDDNSHAELIQRSLRERGTATVLRAPTAERALSMLGERPFHLILLDYSLPDRDGLEVLRDIRRNGRDVPVVFLTSADSTDVCVKAMKGGAIDYIVKKSDYLEQLQRVVSATGSAADQKTAEIRSPYGAIIGDTDEMLRLRASVVRAAASTATVLIEGETGTGKELVARAIHFASARAKKPYVAVNCAEIPEHLFESEFFGSMRGAFTGAIADRKGLLESTQSGTLVLDEIEALASGHQAKFLRVLQTHEFKPVGSTRFLRFDARVIAASNQDLEQLVEQERFRRDLFYRLDVLRIRVPALRERGQDVTLLAHHFIERFNRRNGTRYGEFSDRAQNALENHSWPGNVRELENLIERMLVNSNDDVIDETELLARLDRKGAGSGRDRVVEALARNQWNRERTARDLGISRVTLWRRMSRYGIRS